MSEDRKAADVIPFATPEMLELRRMKAECEEEREAIRRRREQYDQWAERMARPKKEGRAKVAEWCFLNFKFFEPTQREAALNSVIQVLVNDAEPVDHMLKWLCNNFICSDYLYANREDCRKLASVHRRIAKHCPSPFSTEELVRWELEREKLPKKKIDLVALGLVKPKPVVREFEEVDYSMGLCDCEPPFEERRA